MIQTFAILNDSLRQLRSRYLFWVTLLISAFAAAALFATYSFNEQGIRFLWFKTWNNSMIRAGAPGSRDFVSFLFNGVFVKFWLAWGTIILAIISTSSILPDFLASGAVDVSLAKPISRVRLFATKVVGALLFVALQVGVSVGLAYLIIGLKFGFWLHAALWAIPLITLQFFYLYAFSALVAVVTRSTLASLIGTALFWFVVFIVQFASNQIQAGIAQNQTMLEQNEARIAAAHQRARDENRELGILERGMLGRLESRAGDARATLEMIRPWGRHLEIGELFIPKTGDIQRIIANQARAPIISEFLGLMQVDTDQHRPQGMDREEWRANQDASAAAQRAVRRVDPTESLASSIGVTLVILGVATLIFHRRDF